jgi:hypothetical protein
VHVHIYKSGEYHYVVKVSGSEGMTAQWQHMQRQFHLPFPPIYGGEVVTSRYFHRKAVLSTLDQLGKTKTHTQVNLQKTRHTRQDLCDTDCPSCPMMPAGNAAKLLTGELSRYHDSKLEWH